MEDINLVLVGAAGEGIQVIGGLLAEAVAAQGYAVFAWQELESRIRGGHSRFSLRIGERARNAPLEQADLLLALNDDAAGKYRPLVREGGLLVTPTEGEGGALAVPFAQIAEEELGKKLYANTVAVGFLAAAVGLASECLDRALERRFGSKGEEVLQANREAVEAGRRLAQERCGDRCPWELPRRKDRYFLVDGHTSLALGAARAGCRFLSAYPMSPSTSIITYLAREQERLGVFVEQAEDEIAAVNMAIGASYAGARSMTATSGGGFALMVEALSLAGMTETPLVVTLAQRPGPATGLPTRTSQGDLLFAVHAGHGEFPKVVLAPSDPVDAFHQTVRAFNLADRFQVPVILLTDQLLAESLFSVEDLELGRSSPESHLADPAEFEDYRRYRFAAGGVSPRLYPGQSEHLVAADSDEHDEAGHITEDLAGTALPMMEKRLAKLDGLRSAVRRPEEVGVEAAEHVLVGWGSSREAVREAVELLRRDGVAAGRIHFTELWPLPEYRFPEGKRYWTVESNATGQLARLLRSEYPVEFQGRVSRYDGLPLTAEVIRSQFHG
ncbi:MAG: 2-oxoacid:acceptor oxidoreductase subunit alpha [Deferrisomatales bacterium]|nr:2-oxoacid:acceptor oxidoreductase subunit alpha [Deferrisomatales bacterium]